MPALLLTQKSHAVYSVAGGVFKRRQNILMEKPG